MHPHRRETVGKHLILDQCPQCGSQSFTEKPERRTQSDEDGRRLIRLFFTYSGSGTGRAFRFVGNILSERFIPSLSDGEGDALTHDERVTAENIPKDERQFRAVFSLDNPMPTRVKTADGSFHMLPAE
jgi:predicted  nucleic acid-binding Zn-ribbon protein